MMADFSGGGGSGNALEASWVKSFWRSNSLLPSTRFKEFQDVWPAHDFQNVGAGLTLNRFLGQVTVDASVSGAHANFGWDLGASKSRILMIFGGGRARTGGATAFQIGLFFTNTLPADAVDHPKNAYGALAVPNVPRYSVYRTDAANPPVTTLITGYTVTQPVTGVAAVTEGMALYYNDTTNELMMFIRHNGVWQRIINATDSTFTTMRYVGFRCVRASGTPTQVDDAVFVGPVVVYAG